MASNQTEKEILDSYSLAKDTYSRFGVDTEAAVDRLSRIPISLNCWQGDDVCGFEAEGGLTGAGIQATGNYLGRARNGDELRSDADKAFSLIPGKHRFNLHSIYAETGGEKVERNNLEPRHFSRWIDWAKEKGIGLDFNATLFSHPTAQKGFTLSNLDKDARRYWIEHTGACRRIAASMGRTLGRPCIHNIWIPDGFKDTPFNRKTHRETLKDSLDEILSEKLDPLQIKDAVEGKLFGIGTESCVIGSHEFYLSYAVKNQILLTLDTGHFHPTELVSDKISAVMPFVPGVLLHVSRGVRWDSDHVVVLSDELKALAAEIVRGDYLDRVHIGLDFFDASINRLAAWVIGTRSTLTAILIALLEPVRMLGDAETAGDYTMRLALFEEVKKLPFGAVWEYYCLRKGLPPGTWWLREVRNYEKKVLNKRN